jgi:hypothetical protein
MEGDCSQVFRFRGGQVAILMPSPEIETEKRGVLSGAATQNAPFFGILPFPLQGLRGGQAVLLIPLSRIETEKMDVVGGAAANHIHFFVIFPFSLKGEGVRG